MNTKTIPTDKYGQVYYGAKTFQTAIAAIDGKVRALESQGDTVLWVEVAATIVDDLAQHGYEKVAQKVQQEIDKVNG